MNTQEIINNNILLAEFIGWKREKVVKDSSKRPYDFVCPEHIEVIGESDWDYCSDCGRDTYRKNYLFGEDLLFHKSWDWLMEVVDKINSLEDVMVSINRLGTFLKIKEETQFFNIINFSFENLSAKNTLQATYNVCVAFVKWWNQNKGGN